MTHNQTTAIKAAKARVEPSTTRTLSLEHSARLMRRCCQQEKAQHFIQTVSWQQTKAGATFFELVF